jgi:hypothetical protein
MLFIWKLKKVNAEGIWSAWQYLQCDECGRFINRRVDGHKWEILDDGDIICNECFETMRDDGDLTRCDNCGDWMRSERAFWDDDNDRDLCGACWDDYIEECNAKSDVIHPYEYKPDPIFHGAADLQAGIELEFCGHNPAEFASEYFDEDGENNYYFKEDCSVDLELVTHPRDYTSWKCYYSEMERILAGARDYDMDEDKDNGCHIHLSRAGLGADTAEQELTIAKMIIFINRHWDDVCEVAGRNPYEWAPCNGLPDDTLDIETVLQYSDDDRYYAVNIQNYATVELRIFNATCNTEVLYGYIEFAYRLAAYCMEHSVAECYDCDFEEVWD